MSTQVDELIRDILASVSTSAGSPVIARWMNNRYRELVSKVKFRHLRKVGELVLPAAVTAGTISITEGSTTVTPDATAQAAWLISPGADTTTEHWYLRVDNSWYRVSSIAATTAIMTLESQFLSTTSATSTYVLVKRFHSLAADCRWLGSMYFDRLGMELENLSLLELDVLASGRYLTQSIPTHYAQVGVDSAGALLYEIYPPSADAELIRYIYWSLPTSLTFTTTLPDVIDSDVLKEGVLVDVYRYEKLAQISKGNIESDAVLANEEQKQRKIWADKLKDAIRSSRGSDDITFLLTMRRGSSAISHEQRTATDYVYDNYRR